MLKMLLVYGHLIATCIALGRVLQADQKLWNWRKDVLDQVQREYLDETQKIVMLALLALWGSGLLLVLQGYFYEGSAYLLNQKLWAKASVVALLSLNGALLHRIGFPLLQKAPFASLANSARTRLALLGALSMSGWLFAAFLGVARAWNNALPYLHVMGVFAVFALFACVVALIVANTAGAMDDQWSRTGSK
ncbi:hypothetical protein C4K22_3985 [Pseudomonas chlororaphis subsp. aurantiaca]|uniref:DUF2214 family protein n=1 Tax=Pseudomonas chlororaphis subsp. aurantiaca TaxID=86192 RepID=A0AAJ0ZHU5_9PSED|nr:hypothetical protein [Pseudomonas chlororaphis]AZD36724.1 hypothetical protein C4K22_3985 [Pseudomonas chlororaphis subsp. aurantiaca]AZD43064.1 hypothetical protein C4K21_3994 [Pseudomonas chlororaphis subsp. aurantiaca]MBU4632499.1 hypothetical protein [Pseudomonas chlororaphis subsp. aurantiaca]QQX56675.1 hypothetical protein JHW28_18915 [Pseudomonas chlororaphis subsp. aurantiaca]UVE43525.1 hypothetical protein KS461_19205 [Pseudomonas chlororaphis]